MLRDAPWWADFVRQLADESLATLAGRFGVAETDLFAALAATSSSGPVGEESWWPEAVRLTAAGVSLREIGRRFGTSPRRLRRGLARAGVRVGGQDLGDQGLVALAGYRDRLGQEPDSVIAEEAGVTVEAVKGERRRLDIEPYQRPTALPVERDDDWLSPPPVPAKKDKRARPWRDAVAAEPTVIRRPVSRRVVAIPGSRLALEPPTSPPTERPDIGERDPSGFEDDEQRPTRRGRLRIVRPGEDRPVEDEVSLAPGSVESTSSRGANRRRRISPHGEVKVVDLDDVDMASLSPSLPRLAAPRPRPAPGAPPPAPAPEPLTRPPKAPPSVALHAPSADEPVRALASALLSTAASSQPAASRLPTFARPTVDVPAVPAVPTVPPRPAAPIEAVAPAEAAAPAHAAVAGATAPDEPLPVEPLPVEPLPVEPLPVEPLPVEPPPMRVVAVPGRMARRLPAGQPGPTRLPSVPSVVEPPIAAERSSEPSPQAMAPRFGWQVRVAGRVEPILVVSRDLAAAARIAADHLSPDDLVHADISLYLPELARR